MLAPGCLISWLQVHFAEDAVFAPGSLLLVGCRSTLHRIGLLVAQDLPPDLSICMIAGPLCRGVE